MAGRDANNGYWPLCLPSLSSFRSCLGRSLTLILSVLSVTGDLLAQTPGTRESVFAPCPTDCAGWITALLKQDGALTSEPVYYGEVFTNARGGITARNATRYNALLDLPVLLDLEQTRCPLPGRFFLLGQNTHGQGITEDFVGDTKVISNIDSFGNITQIGEYWWEFDLLDDNVTVRIGKQDLNTEFVFIDTASDFIQSAFGLTPSAILPSYPQQAFGAVILAQLTSSLRLKLGAWDALADVGTWGFSGDDTVLLISELEYRYALRGGQLPGICTVGALYETDGRKDGGEQFAAATGFTLQLEQFLYRECGSAEEPLQGFAAFAAYYPRTSSSPTLLEQIDDNLVAGCIYRGLLPGRDEDVVGTGVSWSELFQGGTNQETVFEFFYKAQLTPDVSIQPDLQYIVTPSGIYPDALAVGVRFQLAL